MVNCAMMGVDWTTLTYNAYVAMLAEWNRRHDPDAPKDSNFDAERLGRALAAHS